MKCSRDILKFYDEYKLFSKHIPKKLVNDFKIFVSSPTCALSSLFGAAAAAVAPSTVVCSNNCVFATCKATVSKCESPLPTPPL